MCPRAVVLAAGIALLAAACSSAPAVDAPTTVIHHSRHPARKTTPRGIAQRVLGLPPVGPGPPHGFASPNGDTPLPDGGLLVTEIGPPGWIDHLSREGTLVWSMRSPISYPSDAQLLPNGRILVVGFTDPGRIVEMTRSGRI